LQFELRNIGYPSGIDYSRIKQGDEVICSSFTFSASANPIMYQCATPVFIDSEKDTWNMDPELLEKLLKTG